MARSRIARVATLGDEVARAAPLAFKRQLSGGPDVADADGVIEALARGLWAVAIWIAGLLAPAWVWAVMFVVCAILIIEFG